MTRSGDLSSAPKAQTWRSGKLRRLSALAIAVVALCLAWEVVSSGVAAYLARSSPHTQPLFGRRGPTAVFNAADTALIQEAVALERARRSAATPPNDDNAAAKAPAPPALLDRDELRREVEAQLTSDPLSAQGLRILGQLQPDDAAAPFMAAAANRSLREVIAVFWLEERERRLGRYDEALKYADMLLRARPGLTTQLAPVLTRMLEDPDTTKSMYRLVATNPPWADIFLQLVTTSIIDIRAPLGLFVHLKDANVPVREAIKQSYVDFLLRNRDYDFA